MEADKMQHHGKQMMMMSWGKFGLMMALMAVISFFLMYQLIYSADHFMYSNNRLVSALVMTCTMIVVMVEFMWSMFKGHAVKLAVLIGAAVVGIGLLGLNRSEALNGDVGFMSSMIPHHSIAINNARKARISDPRVRKLADEIISSQVREIREMKLLISDIRQNGNRGQRALPPRTADVTPDMLPKIREAVK